uniref:Uncharacterized protein n=1 Tax=Arundo donax TaxID=35708 RepID=A0A0A9CDG1_ARUDO
MAGGAARRRAGEKGKVGHENGLTLLTPAATTDVENSSSCQSLGRP